MIIDLWKDKLEKVGHPKYHNNVLVQIDKEYFAHYIENRDMIFIEMVIDLLLSGSVIILKKCFEPKFLEKLKQTVWEFKESNINYDSKKFEIINDCPDFWRKVDKPIGPSGGYTFIGNQFYFFRWNKCLPFEEFDSSIWNYIKILNADDKDSFKNNLPKDNVVDRVTFNHYPAGVGYISKHRDPANNQKITPGMVLSDYNDGGFYVVDHNSRKVFIESQVQFGDLIAWYPTVYHGADVPENYQNINDVWNSIMGRWQMSFFSVDSHHKTKRNTAII